MGSEARQGMAALVPKRSFTVTIIIVSPVDVPVSFFSDLVLSMAGAGEWIALEIARYILIAESR